VNPVTEQCIECAWRFIYRPSGHCFMFKDAPTELCMQRKPNLARPVEPFTADTGGKP
jgi:hypothetical protein